MPWKWLQGVRAAAPLALLFVPQPYQLLAQTVYSAVLEAEREGGISERKLAAAMRALNSSMPLILREVERITGRTIVDVAALRQALSKLAEFQVLILKAVGGKPE